jgi:hypothetical protein
MHALFISEPYGDFWYIAERSRVGGKKFIWSIMPVKPTSADIRIAASKVPRHIRYEAYKFLAKRVEHDTAKQRSSTKEAAQTEI